jgi:hypothetical protein
VKIDVKAEWRQYRAACFGKRDLSPDQAIELYRAFFSGMLTGLNLMMALALGPDEDKSVDDLENLRDQVVGELLILVRAEAGAAS